MMFVWHFSFAGDNREPCHALFTCVVEAADIDAAVAKFKRLIRGAAKRGDVFDGASDIYMDSCIELRSVPSGGLMTYITIREGEDIGGISASLLGAAAGSAVAYCWGWSADEDAAEPRPIEPFLRLRGKRVKAKPAEELLHSSGTSDKVH